MFYSWCEFRWRTWSTETFFGRVVCDLHEFVIWIICRRHQRSHDDAEFILLESSRRFAIHNMRAERKFNKINISLVCAFIRVREMPIWIKNIHISRTLLLAIIKLVCWGKMAQPLLLNWRHVYFVWRFLDCHRSHMKNMKLQVELKLNKLVCSRWNVMTSARVWHIAAELIRAQTISKRAKTIKFLFRNEKSVHVIGAASFENGKLLMFYPILLSMEGSSDVGSF